MDLPAETANDENLVEQAFRYRRIVNMVRVNAKRVTCSLDDLPADNIAAAHAKQLALATTAAADECTTRETDGLATYHEFVDIACADGHRDSIGYFLDLMSKICDLLCLDPGCTLSSSRPSYAPPQTSIHTHTYTHRHHLTLSSP